MTHVVGVSLLLSDQVALTAKFPTAKYALIADYARNLIFSFELSVNSTTLWSIRAELLKPRAIYSDR